MNILCLLIALFVCTTSVVQVACAKEAAQDSNVNFRGNLVSSPCAIADSEQGIHVHLGMLNKRELYAGPSSSVPFTLRLTDCDTQVADGVTVTFYGSEDTQLPGLLAVSAADSSASGIAIGLNDGTGVAVKINQSSVVYKLQDGENRLNFNAWVQGEPQAIKDRSIEAGNFMATATLLLAYE